MGSKNKNHSDFDEDDDRKFSRKKQPKHSRNVRGEGMKVINSYVEEEDIYEDEDDQDYTSNFHIKY